MLSLSLLLFIKLEMYTLFSVYISLRDSTKLSHLDASGETATHIKVHQPNINYEFEFIHFKGTLKPITNLYCWVFLSEEQQREGI